MSGDGREAAVSRHFVIDSSIALAWCFPDEQNEYADLILGSLPSKTAIVPMLWHLEIANVLLVGERRKRCIQADITKWLDLLRALPIVTDAETMDRSWRETIELGRTYNLSAYDASYLELASRHDIPIATLDAKLKAAAVALGVAPFNPS